jgi:hypothetical protein
VVSSHVRYVFVCHVIWEREICFVWLRQCFLTLEYRSTCVILDCWNVIWAMFSCTWRIVFVCAAHWFKYCIWRPTDLLLCQGWRGGLSLVQFPSYPGRCRVQCTCGRLLYAAARGVWHRIHNVLQSKLLVFYESSLDYVCVPVLCVGPDWKGVTRVFRERLGMVIFHSRDRLTCSRYAMTLRPDGGVSFGHLAVMCVNLHSSLKDWKCNMYFETQQATMSTSVMKVLLWHLSGVILQTDLIGCFGTKGGRMWRV